MKRRRVLFVAALSLLLGTPALVVALTRVRDGGAMDLVLRAATVHRTLSYSGAVAWRNANWEPPVRVTHDAQSGRTSYLWWGRREMVFAAPSVRTPDPAAWCLDPVALAGAYRAEEGEPTRCLDREARVFKVVPGCAGRPVILLTVDAETLLPLMVSTLRPDGSLYRVAAFREVAIGPTSVKEAAPSRFTGWYGGPVPPSRAEEIAGFRLVRPEYLPEGFRLLEVRCATEPLPSARFIYTDGVTAFEIRQEPLLTPAQIDSVLARRQDPVAAEQSARWIHERRYRALLRQGSGEAAAVARREDASHVHYELRVGRVEVELSARANLEENEILSVIRSLRAG